MSRADILYINDTDIGWRPFVDTWISGLEADSVKTLLPALFDRYVEQLGDAVRRMKTAVPLPLINLVTSLCRLLEGGIETLPKDVVNSAHTTATATAFTNSGAPRKSLPELLEHHFFVAAVWAFGGALIVETTDDGGGAAGLRGNHRLAFHGMISQIGSSVKPPKDAAEGSLVFDFYFNPETENMEHWCVVM